MGASPLRDPVEGGFFRYATRADWSEPHYERMLTDNALLLDVAAALAGGDDPPAFLRSLADGVIGFLLERMQLPNGGFASAQDSESVIDGERSEGGYYRLDASARARLTPPALDEKVLTGWNGLAIGALAHAGFVFDEPGAIAAARRAADFLLEHHLLADGTPVRASLDGVVSSAASTLEDTGMLAGGLLELAVATGDASYAVTARALIDRAAAAAGPAPGSGAPVPFSAPSGGDPVLVARGLALPADPAEGATPSGITACADAAWRLFALGAGSRYLDLAEAAMRGVAGIAVERPIAFGGSLGVMARLATPLVQLVTVVPDDASDELGDAGSAELRAATRRHAASVAAIVTETQALAFAAAGFELFEGRVAQGDATTAYRCRSFVCALPVHDAGCARGARRVGVNRPRADARSPGGRSTPSVNCPLIPFRTMVARSVRWSDERSRTSRHVGRDRRTRARCGARGRLRRHRPEQPRRGTRRRGRVGHGMAVPRRPRDRLGGGPGVAASVCAVADRRDRVGGDPHRRHAPAGRSPARACRSRSSSSRR